MLCTTDDVFVSIEKVQKVALLVSKRHSVDDPLVLSCLAVGLASFVPRISAITRLFQPASA